MEISLVDIVIISIIFSIIIIYSLIRYKEEKRREREMLIPTLNAYKEKFIEEKERFLQKSQKLKDYINQTLEEIRNLKENIHNYPWTHSQIDYLKKMKGSELNYFITNSFEMMGFELIDLPIYKDCNLDIIVKYSNDEKVSYLGLSIIDFTKIKDLNSKFINNLLNGKEKYELEKILVITNSHISEDIKKQLIENDINFFEIDQIVKFIPSLNFFYRYEELKSKYHNYELLHKETFDEVIRREHWLTEVEEKLVKALEKR